jgi:hypothetical protein
VIPVACVIGGALIGAAAGFCFGMAEDGGSDFPMAPVLYAPMGAACGAVAGVVAWAVLAGP